MYDSESGLFQNHHREYQGLGGRYLTSDPIGLQGGINTYAYVEGQPTRLVDHEGLNPVFACYRAGRFGWEIGQNINPYIQPVIARGLDSIFLANSMGAANASPITNTEQRQKEYEIAKNICDQPQPPGPLDCSGLSSQIHRAEAVIKRYEEWDAKYLPGRHAEKIQGWKNRLKDLKEQHNQKCTQCK